MGVPNICISWTITARDIANNSMKVGGEKSLVLDMLALWMSVQNPRIRSWKPSKRC